MAKKSKWNSGVLVPAFLFIGLGTGMLFNQVAAGALIGLGVGFALMFVYVQEEQK